MQPYKKTLLIDLDGVLNQYDGKFNENFIPPVKDGAYQFLQNLSQNFVIKIFTTRNRLLTSKWLFQNNLDKFVTDVTNIKDSAFLYIDDRCICFGGDFVSTIRQINNFRPYWKKSK